MLRVSWGGVWGGVLELFEVMVMVGIGWGRVELEVGILCLVVGVSCEFII